MSDLKNKVYCVMCSELMMLDEIPPMDWKPLCLDCYSKVKAEFEEENPGKSLRIVETDKPEKIN